MERIDIKWLKKQTLRGTRGGQGKIPSFTVEIKTGGLNCFQPCNCPDSLRIEFTGLIIFFIYRFSISC
jgi:hypothetical protein